MKRIIWISALLSCTRAGFVISTFDHEIKCPSIVEKNAEDSSDKLGYGDPYGPLIPCSFLPDEFIECNPLELLASNMNESNITPGYCHRFGGQSAEEVEWVNATCHVLDRSITCCGEQVFLRPRPCIKYTGHYFLSTLLYSVLLGVVAVDRFCLGYSAIAVGKLMTLGGLGVWWIIDIVLLVTGNLTPADDSNWEPYY